MIGQGKYRDLLNTGTKSESRYCAIVTTSNSYD